MRLEGNTLRALPLRMQEQVGLALLEQMERTAPVAVPPEKEDTDVKCDPRAFARCPYNKTCVSAEQTDFEEGSDCFLFNKKILQNPGNHGDGIRGMSDMELASFLHTVTRACADHDCAACPIGPQNCVVMLHWVRQPMEEP